MSVNWIFESSFYLIPWIQTSLCLIEMISVWCSHHQSAWRWLGLCLRTRCYDNSFRWIQSGVKSSFQSNNWQIEPEVQMWAAAWASRRWRTEIKSHKVLKTHLKQRASCLYWWIFNAHKPQESPACEPDQDHVWTRPGPQVRSLCSLKGQFTFKNPKSSSLSLSVRLYIRVCSFCKIRLSMYQTVDACYTS